MFLDSWASSSGAISAELPASDAPLAAVPQQQQQQQQQDEPAPRCSYAHAGLDRFLSELSGGDAHLHAAAAAAAAAGDVQLLGSCPHLFPFLDRGPAERRDGTLPLPVAIQAAAALGRSVVTAVAAGSDGDAGAALAAALGEGSSGAGGSTSIIAAATRHPNIVPPLAVIWGSAIGSPGKSSSACSSSGRGGAAVFECPAASLPALLSFSPLGIGGDMDRWVVDRWIALRVTFLQASSRLLSRV